MALKHIYSRIFWGTLFFGVLVVFSLLRTPVATAAAGINQSLNFQGRLLNAQGAVVPDGYYNIEFNIYQDGDGQSAGDTTGSPAGSLLWSEAHYNDGTTNNSVQVKNGYFSVQLGSICALSGGSCEIYTNPGVDWNQDTLWLSVDIGSTTSCTLSTSFDTDCGGDGEMTPMKRLSSSPYAFNAGELNGLTGANFVKLAQGVQNDASTASSIFINKTGTSGDILELQKGGIDVMSVDNTGNLVLGQQGTTGQNGSLVFNTTDASNTAITIAAAATASSYSLTLPTSAPTTGQCLQTDAASTTQLVFGACGATGTFLAKNATDTSSADAGTGYLYGFTNSGSAGTGGVLNLNNGTNTGTVLNVTGTSTTALNVQDSSSNKVFGVDTTNKQAVLGQSNAVNGALVFKNSTTANDITLNSTNANASYSLSLPSASPAAGLCIETSAGDANQLVFASCSNNNASIQEVQEWDANNTNTTTVSPSTAGDEMVVTTQNPNSGSTVTSISGGGVPSGGWTKVVANNGDGTVNRVEMWVGTVTTTGSAAITINYSGLYSSSEFTVTEFTAAGVTANTSWGIESSSSQLNSTASSTVTYPSLTAVNGSELYFGYAQVQNPPATGNATPGFSYIQTSTQHNMIAYDPSLTANTAYQPTALQSSSGESNTVGAILTAFVTSSSINNTTSLQKANFYVQAASSGTVAGVLQAASSGSADIFDIRNSSNLNVVTVGATGDVTVGGTGATASASALQVQNTSGQGVLSVDTSGNQVILGSSNAIGGKLTFADATDGNTVTIGAPTTFAATYTLSLPSEAPTGGLCLGTKPSDAYQLIYASCATAVSAASISYVGESDTNGTDTSATGPWQHTVADSPASIGNLLVVYTHAANNVTVSSVSGGGVTNWSKVTAYNGGGTPGNIEMWRGVVTASGANTITVSFSAAPGAYELATQEFGMGGSGGTWAVDTSGTSTTTSSVTTVNYPSLTPANSSELYTGYAFGGGTMSCTNGTFTFVGTALSKYMAYDTNVTGGTTYAPTCTQTSGVYASIAAAIQAYAGTSVIVNSTATQQANFNVQATLSGTVAGVLQGVSGDTTDILQVQNGAGNNVAAVNHTGLTLGTSNTLAGSLTFAASGNNNTIGVTAPSTPGASYTLTLPSTTPAPGECLSSSPSNADQLVFSSCANQVTSVAISEVNHWSASAHTLTTLSVSPANVGDLMVFFSSPSGNASLTGLSGGGVSVWSKVTATASGSGSGTTSIDMWKGVVTTAGASTITISYTGSLGNPNELAAMEFSTGSTTGSWVVDASNTLYNGTSSTTMTFPDLTPQSSKDLYVGYGATSGTTSGTVSSGFTYVAGAQTTTVGLYDTNVSTATQPTDTLTTAGSSLTVGALIAAYSSSSVISNSTVTQQANFNVQAATSGSVAGVLQAYGGTSNSDILDLLDGSGATVDSFGSTGNLTVAPSTASAAALQVQNTSGTNPLNVFSVDTSANQVVIGAGSTGETSPSLLVLDSETGTASDPTEVDGAIYYNATSRTFRCGAAGAWQNCSGLLYANSSNSSANNNCTNNCVAFSNSVPVPANYCQTGRVIKLDAAGYFSSLATASNLQFGVYYGTDASVASNDTLIGSLTPAATVTSASNNYFELNFNITCFSTTSMQAGGVLSLNISGSTLTSLPMSNSTTATTVVSSSAKNLYIFPVWDTASTSNTATLTQLSASSP